MEIENESDKKCGCGEEIDKDGICKSCGIQHNISDTIEKEEKTPSQNNDKSFRSLINNMAFRFPNRMPPY